MTKENMQQLIESLNESLQNNYAVIYPLKLDKEQ